MSSSKFDIKTVYPDYYSDFSCIANECRHNCCIGWEIDIDEESLAYYNTVEGRLSNKLNKEISLEGTPHFRLNKDERCPFLDNDNLCEIITELGEDKLCKICSEHPRFYNFYTDRTEMGLGLCCEATARLIIKNEKTTRFVNDCAGDELLTEGERRYFDERKDILSIIQNRKFQFAKRIEMLSAKYNLPHICFDDKWINFFLKLERLDNSWTELIESCSDYEKAYNEAWEIPLEQLLVYFVYRHTPKSIEDNQLRQWLAFCILSVNAILSLCPSDKMEDLIETARMYSAEIEYSDENIDLIIANVSKIIKEIT